LTAELRKKVVIGNGFWKINAIRPKIKARRGRMKKFELGQKANWRRLVKELGCQIVTQELDSVAGWISKMTTQIGAEWCTFHRQFLIPQTAIFCMAMDA
jgi:hypothetical protein